MCDESLYNKRFLLSKSACYRRIYRVKIEDDLYKNGKIPFGQNLNT